MAAGCHCNRAPEPTREPLGGAGFDPREREDPSCLGFARDAPRCLGETLRPPFTRLVSEGRYLAHRLAMNKLTPLPRDGWARCWGATEPPAAGPGTHGTARQTPTKRAPWRSGRTSPSQRCRWHYGARRPQHPDGPVTLGASNRYSYSTLDC